MELPIQIYMRYLKKINISINEEYDKLYPVKQPSLVKIWAGGHRYEEYIEYPPGDKADPVDLMTLYNKASRYMSINSLDRFKVIYELISQHKFDEIVSI